MADRKGKRASKRMLSSFVIVVAVGSSSVLAQAQSSAARDLFSKQSFSIPAGPLGATLLALGRAANSVIVFDSKLTEGKTAEEVQGTYSIEVAIGLALARTGLIGKHRADGAIVIVLNPSSQAPTHVAEQSSSKDQLTTELPDINVSGTLDARASDEEFIAHSVNSVTRTETLLAEIPQSVQVITEGLIASRQAASISDVLANVSSVTKDGDDNFLIRGFSAPLRVNGGAIPGTTSAGQLTRFVPMIAVDRVVVLKGADAITAGGESAPGGMVDVITKLPQARTMRSFTLEAGSLGHKSTSIDLTGAFSNSKRLAYRLTAEATSVARDVSGLHGKRTTYVAPTLSYNDESSSLTVGVSSREFRAYGSDSLRQAMTRQGPQGIAYLRLPIAERDFGSQARTEKVFYQLTQKLPGDWSFASKADFSTSHTLAASHSCSISAESPAEALCNRLALNTGSQNALNTLNTISTTAELGGARHTFLLGSGTTRNYTPTAQISFALPQRVAYSRNQLAPTPLPEPPDPAAFSVSSTRSSFVQNQIKWGAWNFLANYGRSSIKSEESAVREQSIQRTTTRPTVKPTYSLGAAYALSDVVTIFANNKTTFERGTMLTAPGIVDGAKRSAGYISSPVDGKSNEVGLKLNLLEDQMNVNASMYRAAKRNVLTYAGLDMESGLETYAVLPTTLSKGFELDIQGRLSNGWNLTGSLNYIDFSYGKPSAGDAELSQLPHVNASAWSSYEFQSAELHGWGFGVGFNYRAGYNTPVGYRMPGQLRVDASLFYKTKDWTATLGVKNVFNRQLYDTFSNGDFVTLEPQRSVVLTANFNF